MTKANVDPAATRGILASIDTAISQTRTAAAVDRVLQSAAPSIWGCMSWMLEPWYYWDAEGPVALTPEAPKGINSTHPIDCDCRGFRCLDEDTCRCIDPWCVPRTIPLFLAGVFSFDGESLG